MPAASARSAVARRTHPRRRTAQTQTSAACPPGLARPPVATAQKRTEKRRKNALRLRAQAAAPHRNVGQLARQRARRSAIHVQDRLAWQRARRCASGAASQHASGAASNAGTAVPDDRLKLCAGELPNGTSDADGSSARPCVQDCKNASMRARALKRRRTRLTRRAAAELAQHARCWRRPWLSQGAWGTSVGTVHGTCRLLAR
jgi:hypothetical protein